MGYKFGQIHHREDWNQFVVCSPQGTIFSSADFLDCYGYACDFNAVYDGEELVAAMAVPKDSKGAAVKAPLPLGLYQQSMLYSPKLWSAPVHSRVKESLAVTEFFLNHLWDKYGQISLSLHHSIRDSRAMDWFHFHERERGVFQVKTLYTGLINTHLYTGFPQYLEQVRRTRRQEYQAGFRKGLSISISKDWELLADLYQATFERQSMAVSDDSFEILRKAFRLATENGAGEMRVCSTSEGQAVAATLFLFDARARYYLIGANHPEARSLNAGSFLLLDNIRAAFEGKVPCIDLVGVNSPNRGDFKTSFNAEPTPYFVANCCAPNES
jgi:hypothetical protein